MLTKEIILDTIKSNKDKIKSFGVNQIGLFGSYAKDKPSASSDIDVLVIFESGKKNYDNLSDLYFLLEDLFKCKIDLVTPEGIPSLLPYISNEVIYETFN
jgi:uncharacterized protein